jgi:putative transposase
MNRGVSRGAIFEDDADRRYFTDLVKDYRDACGASVYHWAWMDTHYHMLAEVVFENLRAFAGGIQQSYVQYHHKRHRSSGVFWQGRFKSRPVEVGEYLIRCGRYIERNPVRAGIVDDAWDYEWSSAAAYVLGSSDGLTDLDVYIGADRWQPMDRQAYADALQASDDDEWMQKRSRSGTLGGVEFAGQLKKEGGRYRRRRGRPVKYDIPERSGSRKPAGGGH